jgi:hypothetical protein
MVKSRRPPILLCGPDKKLTIEFGAGMALRVTFERGGIQDTVLGPAPEVHRQIARLCRKSLTIAQRRRVRRYLQRGNVPLITAFDGAMVGADISQLRPL